MKFQIRRRPNSVDGSDMFDVYRDDGGGWIYCNGYAKETEARACVDRFCNPVKPVVIAEICGNRLENGQICGDEGHVCEGCQLDAEVEHSWMRGQSKGACTGVMSDEEKQDLCDAGRGHLV